MAQTHLSPDLAVHLATMQLLARHFFLIIALIAGAVPFARDMSQPVSRLEVAAWLVGFVCMAIYVVQTLLRMRQRKR